MLINIMDGCRDIFPLLLSISLYFMHLITSLIILKQDNLYLTLFLIMKMAQAHLYDENEFLERRKVLQVSPLLGLGLSFSNSLIGLAPGVNSQAQ